MIGQFIMWILAKNPAFASAIVVMGTLRIIFKPIMSALLQVVDLTETKADNEFVAKVMSSKVYIAVAWLFDWVASVKLPQQKK